MLYRLFLERGNNLLRCETACFSFGLLVTMAGQDNAELSEEQVGLLKTKTKSLSAHYLEDRS